MVTFRKMNIETDAAEMARLYSYTVAEPITAQTAVDWWTLREGQFRVVMFAQNDQGEVVGYWDVERETWMKPGMYYVKVIVAPPWRCRGLGSQMFAEAVRVAREQGATHLESSIRESDAASLRFARSHGFEIVQHSFESTLDLADFDAHQFDGLMDRMHAEGFRFFSLAEAGNTAENRHKLYDVNRASSLDDPGSPGTFPDFYAFSKNVFDASWFRADTQILASHGDDWVGLAAIGIYQDDKHAYNAFTGVMRDYRGRGLAQALKLQTVLLAKREGMRYIRTNNDSNNAPMLAINRKLGYKPEPGIYRIESTLDQN